MLKKKKKIEYSKYNIQTGCFNKEEEIWKKKNRLLRTG